jgi:hypothetical protein
MHYRRDVPFREPRIQIPAGTYYITAWQYNGSVFTQIPYVSYGGNPNGGPMFFGGDSAQTCWIVANWGRV